MFLCSFSHRLWFCQNTWQKSLWQKSMCTEVSESIRKHATMVLQSALGADFIGLVFLFIIFEVWHASNWPMNMNWTTAKFVIITFILRSAICEVNWKFPFNNLYLRAFESTAQKQQTVYVILHMNLITDMYWNFPSCISVLLFFCCWHCFVFNRR